MSWTKVKKEMGTDTKVDRGTEEGGWFSSGWFTGWFGGAGGIWQEVIKTVVNFTKIIKDVGKDTKVEKETEDWNKVTKE